MASTASDPFASVRKPREPCGISGCPRDATSLGWCGRHYQHWRRHGDPIAKYPRTSEPKKTCKIKGCTEVPTSRGWCSRHYQRWKRHGNPRAVVTQRPTVWEVPAPDRGAVKYGLTSDDLAELMDRQGRNCAVCSTPLELTGMRSYNIDHCHATGRVRGLLCRPCNWGIGLLGDDPDRLEAAARYLRSAPSRPAQSAVEPCGPWTDEELWEIVARGYDD